MQHSGADKRLGDEAVVLRREVLGGGSLVLGALFLGGCKSSQSTAALPGPYWTSQPPTTAPAPVFQPTPAVASCPTTPPPVDTSVPMGVVPRSTWTGKGVSRPGDINPMNGIRRITVHHDGLPPTTLRTNAQVAARIEVIRSSHVSGRGWADIGYHYLIDPQGRVWEGRSIRYQGAHVKDQNENNMGVLVLGNFEMQSPSPAALSSLDRFVADQMRRYGVPMSRVRTHQELAPTECPGRNLQMYMVRTRGGGGQMAALAGSNGFAQR